MQSDVVERKYDRLDEADLQIRGARENLKAAAATLRPAKGAGNVLKLLSSCQKELNSVESELDEIRRSIVEHPGDGSEASP